MELSEVEVLFQLISIGIGNAKVFQFPDTVDWEKIADLAAEHGLLAIIVDAIEKLPDTLKPPKPVLLQWIGETLQGYEYRYEQYCKSIAEIASYYNKHGFKMMILKGYACSLDWPRPDHRPCGDIDIWLFGEQKAADARLSQNKGVEIDNSHHHHTVFYWRDFMVENHYDFINTHDFRSSKRLEQLFKQLGEDDSHSVEVFDEKVYIPSSNLHALFLLRHMAAHFASTSVTLRHVLDWGFFVRAHKQEIDWQWFYKVIAEYHMMDFYNYINAICVENLEFEVSTFPSVQFDPRIKKKVLNDILNPKYTVEEPKGLICRVIYKYRRWQGNAWKQELCYNESRWSAFFHGLWMHLLKPKSI